MHVNLVLKGGDRLSFACEASGPLFDVVSDIVDHLGQPPSDNSNILQLSVSHDDGTKGIAIARNTILAVETIPAFAFNCEGGLSASTSPLYARIPNFLSADENAAVMEFTLATHDDFFGSTVSDDLTDFRQSKVIYNLDKLSIDFESKIEELVPEANTLFNLPHMPEFRLETQLTAHNDGDFFKTHTDNGSQNSADRQLTYVYYFNKSPVGYSGGAIRLYGSCAENGVMVASEEFMDIQPENNMLLLFPSSTFHQVLPVECPSREFSDGRFTLNGWVRSDVKTDHQGKVQSD